MAAAVAMIQYTPPEVVITGVSASARRPTLLAPAWCENRWSAMTAIAAALALRPSGGTAWDALFSLPSTGECQL